MKKIIPVVLLIVITNIHAFAQKTHEEDYFTEKDSIHINGKVIGFKPGAGDDFISFITYDITRDSKKLSFQLKTDGTFNVMLYQPFRGNISLSYRGAFENLYVQPGENLFLNIQNDRIDAPSGNKNAFTVKGKLADVNNILFDFQTEFKPHQFNAKADLGDKTQSDSIYIRKRTSQLNEELDFLNAYINDKGVTNITFEKWQRNQLIYSAAKEMLLFPFFGKLNKSISEPQLIGFIKHIPINNNEALTNSAYYDFLNMLVTDEQIIININPAYDAVRKINGYNSIPLYLDKIDHLSTGLTREIMYYDLYMSHLKFNDASQVLSRFNLTIHQPYLKRIFDESSKSAADGFKPYDIIERLKGLKVSDTLKQKLIDLFVKEKGTNLYIDFWGDWCGPCMMEMPAYPKFIAEFEGRPLKFIFFSAQTTEKSMLAVKEQNHINGEFINLTKDEVDIMNNAFEFHSYPSHFVINSASKVISNNTRKTAEINKLLWP
jgi:thiol-disulfide isomerase/thioredoxin